MQNLEESKRNEAIQKIVDVLRDVLSDPEVDGTAVVDLLETSGKITLQWLSVKVLISPLGGVAK